MSKTSQIILSHSPKGKAFYTVQLFRNGQLVGTQECKTMEQAKNQQNKFAKLP
jgi:hypothetical protein